MPPRTKIRPFTFLIPAKNSRHRTACLALYRALLRLSPGVVLPPDLAAGWGPGKNPIAIQIERSFRRNRADVSPRIIQPALTAGYHMLSVLRDAATSPSSPHYTEIVSFLRSRLEERNRSLANRPPPSPPSLRPGTLPLLVKVSPAPSLSNPDPQPEYVTPHRPRPQSELGGTGRRKVPHMDMAFDFPFMRLTKPQPPILSHVLRYKITRRVDRTTKVCELWEQSEPDARLEDAWDTIISRQMEKEQASSPGKGIKNPNWAAGADLTWQDKHDVGIGTGKDERSHAYTVRKHGINVVNSDLTRERIDLVARADAMRRLIKQEKALAAEEKAQRAADKRARWEARMLELHGRGWRDLFPNLKESERSGGVRKVEWRGR